MSTHKENDNNNMSQQKNSKLFLIILLGTMSAFGPFIIDLYLPSLPELKEYFNTTPALTQVSLMTAMIGMAVGQLILGPVSDKVGRKKPLVISLIIFTLTSVALIFAPNIHVLITLRAIQGLSAAGSVVLSRAIATDLYRGRELGTFFALLMTVHGIAPVISPMAGSFLLTFTDWHGVFVSLTILGLMLLTAVLFYHESLPPEKRFHTPLLQAFAVYPTILRNKAFMGFVAMQSLGFGGLFSYISASPFIFQSSFNLSLLAFSLCFGANGLGVMTGANVGNKLDGRLAVRIGVSLFWIATVYLACALNLHWGVYFVEAGFFAMTLSLGFIFPTVSMQAMSAERKNAGTASALVGFFPFFVGAICSPLVGIGDIFIATSIVLVISSTLTALVYFKVKDKMVFD